MDRRELAGWSAPISLKFLLCDLTARTFQPSVLLKAMNKTLFITEKGKPVVRPGRKAMGHGAGFEGVRCCGCQVAEGMDGALIGNYGPGWLQ